MWRIAVLGIVLAASAARADAPQGAAVGFDHRMHDRDVIVNGGESIACARCHEEPNGRIDGQVDGRLVGRPGHAACFGKCHGAAPVAPKRGTRLELDPARIKVCTNCHAEAQLVAPFGGKLPVTYPPYLIDPDFNVSIGHKQHRELACTLCHDQTSAKRPRPHQRCAGCHDAKPHGGARDGRAPCATGSTPGGECGSIDGLRNFKMSDCKGCHPPSGGKPQPPELAAIQNSVGAVFSHATHAARGGGGKECVTCHAKIKEADETQLQLPRPTVRDCAHCHDGKTAFAATGACTKCHDKAPERFEVARPDARFRHDREHAPLVTSEPCSSCHVLDTKTGEVAIAGHAACTSCHADDFELRFPTKCGACHNATEPWRHLRADRPPPDTTEFGASLDHTKHAATCTTCHAFDTRTTQLRMPRGHRACTGNGCHAVSSGPGPLLAECIACHRLGLAAARASKRIAEPWSVRLAFDHRPHAKASDGSPLACTTCHEGLAAQTLLDVPAPPKATCAGCHEGKRAFKLTGTTCRRCHVSGPVK